MGVMSELDMQLQTARRVMGKVSVGQSGCWEWTAHKDANGYGGIGFSGKKKLAHRVMYELRNGPIPDGACVCHSCDNPACVNPDHLFLGSHAENMADMASKGRAPKGETHVAAKLTEADVLAIRAETGTQQEIAAKYGISTSQVSRIRLGQTWKHVSGGPQ
jgi:hypothetical protein